MVPEHVPGFLVCPNPHHRTVWAGNEVRRRSFGDGELEGERVKCDFPASANGQGEELTSQVVTFIA